MKHFVLAIATLALLSGCTSGQSTTPLVGRAWTNAGKSAGSDARTGPLAQEATPANVAAHIVYPVRSVYEVVYAKGYKAAAYTLDGKCSLTRGPGGVVTGCVISGGSASPYYKQSSFYLHNKPNGNGCTLAVGHFHGQTYSGQVIPMTFYWVKNSCYP